MENTFIPSLSLQASKLMIKTISQSNRKDVCISFLPGLQKCPHSLFDVGCHQGPADWYLPDRDPSFHVVVDLCYRRQLYLQGWLYRP
jgi:hypothetical protein